MLAKDTGEVFGALKPQLIGNGCHTIACRAQQLFGAVDAQCRVVVHHRASRILLEDATKMALAEVEMAADLLQAHGAIKMRVQIGDDVGGETVL